MSPSTPHGGEPAAPPGRAQEKGALRQRRERYQARGGDGERGLDPGAGIGVAECQPDASCGDVDATAEGTSASGDLWGVRPTDRAERQLRLLMATAVRAVRAEPAVEWMTNGGSSFAKRRVSRSWVRSDRRRLGSAPGSDGSVTIAAPGVTSAYRPSSKHAVT